ncbi:hypothetical protein O181_043612 [Austropuccinia psidii MF-1]|uniref:Reverse transcriptase domain-containing protein n=1 Tax=Austropuccinia psidii MF-1 TaxID=1389203 RepID=A0A9Q3DQ59_9BASI|nr:hypothetical protein [Austropuccinia psidii MF-1]
MKLIDYIDGLFIDVPSIPDYWINARLNTEFKGHASIWYTEMKEIHGRRNWPCWKNQIMQKYRNVTWIWQKTSCFREKPPFGVEFKDKCRERVAEVTKNKNSCHNSGSTDHYANDFSKAKKKVYAIEQVPEEESPPENSESDSMGYSIREQSDEDKDPREEFLVEYQEETPLEIQDIKLEAHMPQDPSNKNFRKHTQDAQKFPVTTTKGMEFIHGEDTMMTFCIDNAQHPLIIDSQAHSSTVARNYLDHHFPNSENQLFLTKAKSFKSASGKTKTIRTIIKDIMIPHRKGNIRLNPELVVLEEAQIQGCLLGTDYQRIFSLDVYQISTHDPLEELLNEFRKGQFSTTLTSKQKLSLLKILRKNRPEFAIGGEQLGKIRGHDIELYLEVETPYPPILRNPPYPESLETRKQIEKHFNELLDMHVIRMIGHNEIMEIITPVLITWLDGKSRLFVYFRALNNYTKADRDPIPRIPHVLDKLAKAKYITKMDSLKGFHQNRFKANSMKFLRIICHMGIYEYTRMPFGIKNAPAHFQRMMDTIF